MLCFLIKNIKKKNFFLFFKKKSSMNYSITALFKAPTYSINNLRPCFQKSLKPLFICPYELWKFFTLYEIVFIFITFSLVSIEFLSNSIEKIRDGLFISQIILRVLQFLLNILMFYIYRRRDEEESFGRLSNRCFLVANSYFDILMFCHFDINLIGHHYETEMISVLLKSLFFSLFLDRFRYINLTFAISASYIMFWTQSVFAFSNLNMIKCVIYLILLISLHFGCAYFLKRSKQSKKYPKKKNQENPTFFFNPFLEIIPEGIILVKLDKDFQLAYHNEYIFKTLEVEKFGPLKLADISVYLANFVNFRKIQENTQNSSRGRSKTLKTYRDLNELLSYLKTLENEQESSECHYFIGNRVNPLNEESFQIELTIKKILIKEEVFFIILLQSMKMKKLVESLQEQDDFKTRLLSSFSHELKTPLNGTIPCLEILLTEEEISQEIKDKYILPSLSSLKLLQSTINDIIDYSLISSDQILLNIRPMNIYNILLDLQQLLKPQLDAKKITLVLDAGNLNINPSFYSDYNRITQILLNILINALKFTNSEGEILFKITNKIVSLVEYITFEIKDNGIGMDEKRLQEVRAFLKKIAAFESQNIGLNINSTGCGFGLLISQSIALLLGPDNEDEETESGIRIESIKDVGTSVSFVITDKKPIFKNSAPVFKGRSSKGNKSTIIQDSVKIEFRRQFILSNQKSNKSGNFSVASINSHNNHDLGVHSEIDFDQILKNHDFNDGLKLITHQNEKPKISNLLEVLEKEIGIFDSINEKLPSKCFCEKVLLVDDDIFNLLSLEMLLKPWNLSPKKAMNGQEAVDIIKNRYLEKKICCPGFKLIFMDYQMPIKDGVDATIELIDLMKKGKIVDIPIIGCTAFVTKKEINRCFEAGMKDVLFKPLNKLVISEIVSNWLN